MAVIVKLNKTGRVAYYCPGCKTLVYLNVDNDGRPRWMFDGNFDKPTITPSVLQKVGPWGECHDVPERIGKVDICHTFVRNGQIEYLGDCTHELAGKNIPMVEIPERYLTEGWGLVE